ncbi:M48 family metallopeptidase [Motilibacter deserti]|uniref:M48 family metallopeptidase n=1 Tax=Motilibacter deserti TaxID=2714956 RepID=A0ABX0GRK5_9ACTN|nr:M48 family metallopeptidase [Motilibacter deserti]
MNSRSAALVALLVLGAALVAVVWVTTPWTVLPGPVPGGRVAVDASRDFTPAQIAHADAYRASVRPWSYASLALGLVALLVLASSGLGGRMIKAVAAPLGGGWGWQAALGAVALWLVVRAVQLPFDAMVERGRQRYGISTRSWPSWLADVAKSWAVTAVLLVVVALLAVALARGLPRWWWAPASALAAVVVVVASFGYPVVVEPLFNKFTPMAQGQLRTDLLALAERDGVPVEDVLVADASRRTTALNAYVSGFGSTRRIVVYDTLLQEATPREIELIAAHELGHAKRDDVLHGTLVGALGVAAAVCLLYLLTTSAPVLRRAGADSAADPRSLAVLLGAALVLSTLSTPLQSLISRHIEARADVHSLDLTRDPGTFVQMQRRLALTNLSDLSPPWLAYTVFSTHPTAPQRIALARDWARRQGVPEPTSQAR